ncbi:MAG: rane-bound dehydrogenase domain protein [Verrucomicrobiaceae bacterium]|nr:rane-bound dehydrogenase domain protein [Verrucomicrobiaceae bacterium]
MAAAMLSARSIALLAFFSPVLAWAEDAVEPPKINDESLQATLFAANPLIQTPIGMTFDRQGRLLVIESQTHFRPKDWKGPAHDQIVWLKDTDGDGKADARQVILDQTDMTMDIATAPDGSIYLSTRNEILRLSEQDENGVPARVERKMVWLETEGRYPHNGLSGLAFDGNGGLYFGMGENLGAAYTLTGSDGKSFSDQGEGGNIWHITADGKNLRRVATGFWNPFGVCVDPWGNVFATDNDPDSSPPCRLNHIIEGGDHGYEFRYGRSGLHPFISWNGQLPGTLPMLSGTGEAPCDVIFYSPAPASVFSGLGTQWQGTLLVASWVDHRIESYRLHPKNGTFKTERVLLAEGGQDFRPVAFATAADGSLFVSDWVKRDYELHGKGRVWRIAAKTAGTLPKSSVQPYPPEADTALRERILGGSAPGDEEALGWLSSEKPYIQSAAIHRLAQEGAQLAALSSRTWSQPRLDAALLLAARKAVDLESLKPDELPAPAAHLIERGLSTADSQLALLAMKWVSDKRLAQFRPLVENRLMDEGITPALYYAGITTLARLESATTSEAELVKRLKQDIIDPLAPLKRKRLALEIMPDRDRNLKAAEIAPLIDHAENADKTWLVHYLGTLRDPARLEPLHAIAFDEKAGPGIRAAALLHAQFNERDVATIVTLVIDPAVDDGLQRAGLQALQGAPLTPEAKRALEKVDKLSMKPAVDRVLGRPHFPPSRPDPKSLNQWRTYLDRVPNEPDLANGRNVFMSSKLGSCAVCHRADGIGHTAGPNLSTIANASTPDYLLESLLQPSLNVAPQYQTFLIKTSDGQSRAAFELNERGDTHTYSDLAGQTFEVKIGDIISRTILPVSIMPEGLVNKLTDEEVRDLVAFLRSLGSTGQ